MFFFFQAEDGIRDGHVTGVQTCALPILLITTWKRLWMRHQEAKDLIRFFVKPNDTSLNIKKKANTKGEPNPNGNGDEPSSFKPSQLIGLILGPLLFIMMLLFFKPADLSTEGVAVAASTIWIAIWWITDAVPIHLTYLMPLVFFSLTICLNFLDNDIIFDDGSFFLLMSTFY